MDDLFPSWPRAMRAELACKYCGLSQSDFMQRVQAGEFKPASPNRAGGGDKARISLYLRDDLDAWINRLFGVSGASPTEQRAQLAEAINRRKGGRGRQNTLCHQEAR